MRLSCLVQRVQKQLEVGGFLAAEYGQQQLGAPLRPLAGADLSALRPAQHLAAVQLDGQTRVSRDQVLDEEDVMGSDDARVSFIRSITCML